MARAESRAARKLWGEDAATGEGGSEVLDVADRPHLDGIVAVAADEYGVAFDAVMGPGKLPANSIPRAVAAYRIRGEGFKLAQMSAYFGRSIPSVRAAIIQGEKYQKEQVK